MNPFLGVVLHAIGGLSSASFYVPVHKVRHWAWETYWVTLGFVAWVAMPQIGGWLTTPDLWGILRNSPISSMAWSYLFGVLWGVGGLTCGLSLRYMGLSLGQSISLGFCAAFGTIIPPIFDGTIDEVVRTLSGQIVLVGIAVCLGGIALCGYAGVLKERQLTDAQKKEVIKDFSLAKGFMFATFGGIMSSCMAFAIKAGDPIAQAALEGGTERVFMNNPTYVLAMGGGFTTNFIAAVILSTRNRSFGNYVLKPYGTLMSNYFLAMISGMMWYGQFFFYGMGTTKMGRYDFASWTLHMAFIIIFSNLWGLYLREWRLVDARTKGALGAGILTLILSTLLIGYGNSLAAKA
ncbi:MAG: sugar:proton symporter [Phycisphaerae bacterium]